MGYRQSWKDGIFGKTFGFKSPRILTVTISQERIENMIQVNKDLDERGTGLRIFSFICEKAFNLEEPENIFKKIWLNGRGEKVGLLG